MSNFIFKSSDVKVFPCAYRGQKTTAANDAAVFDPEARLQTEYNYRKPHKSGKWSYIVEDASSTEAKKIKFVLGGYFFEISNIDSYKNELKNKYLQIKLKDNVVLVGEEKTTIMINQVGSGSISALDNEINGTYYFTGIDVVETPLSEDTNTYYSLMLFDENGNTCKSSLLPIEYTSVESNNKGINITGYLVDGTGDSSIAQINVIDNGGAKNYYINEASKHNSVALGDHTTSDKENLVVVGKYNKTKTGDLFVVGNGRAKQGEETEDVKSNVLEVGEESVIINKPLATSGKAIIAKDNDVELSKAGKATTVKGSLQVNQAASIKSIFIDGSLDQTGVVDLGKNADNITEVGKERSAVKIGKSSQMTEVLGNLKVHDDTMLLGELTVGADESEQSATIHGVAEILGTTDSSATTNGALHIAGGVGIEKKLNVGSDTSIEGKVTIANEISQTNDKQVSFSGNVDAKNGIDIFAAELAMYGKATTESSETKNFSVDTKGNITTNVDKTNKCGYFNDIAIKYADGKIDIQSIEVEGKSAKVELDNISSVTITNCISSMTNGNFTKTGSVELYSKKGTLKLSTENDEDTTIDFNGSLKLPGDYDFYVGKQSATETKSAVLYQNVTKETDEKGQDKKITISPDWIVVDTTATKNAIVKRDNDAGITCAALSCSSVSSTGEISGASAKFGNIEINKTTDTVSAANFSSTTKITAKAISAESFSTSSFMAEGIGIKKYFDDKDYTINIGAVKSTTISPIPYACFNFCWWNQEGMTTTSNIYYYPVESKIGVENAAVSSIEPFAGNWASRGKGSITINLKTPTESTEESKLKIKNVTNNTEVFYVDYSGNVSANTYNATSDKRLKENIIEYKPEKSILDLQVYKYDFIDGPKNNIGCLAQDLQEICPEIVHENENGYLSIEENKLVYLLLDEVKKLKEEINKLK